MTTQLVRTANGHELNARLLEPQGEPRIGHFGFFRRAFETLPWKDRLLPELR